LIKRFANLPEDATKHIDQVKRKRSKSMPKLNELMLSTELNLNVDEIIKDRFKTTDLIQIKFSFKFKVFSFKSKYQVLINKQNEIIIKVDAKSEGLKTKINMNQLNNLSDNEVKEKLKKDLENLIWNSKPEKVEKDEALLMVI